MDNWGLDPISNIQNVGMLGFWWDSSIFKISCWSKKLGMSENGVYIYIYIYICMYVQYIYHLGYDQIEHTRII